MEQGAHVLETRLRDEIKLRDGGIHHNKDLFDENGDGRDIDEASGKPWDDTGGVAHDEELTVVSENGIDASDEYSNDAAGRWIKEKEAQLRLLQNPRL